MKKILPLSVALIALLLLATCEREWSNPFDPNNTLDPEAWAPQNLQIETTSITERQLTWTYNGPATIQGFKIDRKKGDEAWQVALAALPKEDRTWNDTTLIPQTGLTYQYRIYTYAGNNSSADKTTSTQTDFPAPSDLTITKLSDISYKLEWKDNSTGEQGFKIDRKAIDNEWVIGYASVVANDTSFVDTNVFVGKSSFNLEYRVYAHFKEFVSAKTEASTTASLTPPTDLIITNNTITSVTLSWKDNSTGEEGFRIERKYGTKNWELIALVSETSHIDGTFEMDTNVHYRIAAYLGQYLSGFAEKSFNSAIQPPETLTISVNSVNSVTLNWNYSLTGHEGFKIDRKLNEGVWQDEFTVLSPSLTSFTDNTVNTQDNTYRYRVYAYLSYNVSEKVEKYISKPTVTTGNISGITGNSATGGGNVGSDGGSPVIQRGICWSTSSNPTISNQLTINGSGTGSFTSSLNGLSIGTTYHVRAYAISKAGISYGTQVSFSTANLPTVTTVNISNITSNSATGGGNVTTDGSATVTTRGIVWSTSQYPTISNNTGITNNGTGTGIFTSSLTGLTPVTSYYVRAYATNIVGTTYGNQVQFTTSPPPCVSFTDSRDGNTYNTIKIGTQCWMKENLKWLPSVSPSSNGSNTAARYYVYDYQGTSVTAAKQTANYQTYGVLYNWPSALSACPAGWHLPSDIEWTILIDFLGGSNVAGGSMKTTGTTYWNSPNTGATNESGFSGLPGGFRYSNGSFLNQNNNGYWWSSAESSATNAFQRFLTYLSTDALIGNNFKEIGLSARCLRDF